jgi:hypothetical protein
VVSQLALGNTLGETLGSSLGARLPPGSKLSTRLSSGAVLSAGLPPPPPFKRNHQMRKPMIRTASRRPMIIPEPMPDSSSLGTLTFV